MRKRKNKTKEKNEKSTKKEQSIKKETKVIFEVFFDFLFSPCTLKLY